jgi:hypothetical protein
MEKFIENLTEADKIIRTADHMIYVTFPLIKDKRLLLKILTETQIALAKCINAILQYEYLYKRIKLYNKAKENLNTFKTKCASRYGINQEELELILEIFDISEKHKESPFEFMKEEKIVILSDNMEQKTLTSEKIKQFIEVTKNLLKKTHETIKRTI